MVKKSNINSRMVLPWSIEKDYVSDEKQVYSGWIIRNAKGKYICTVTNSHFSAEDEANFIVQAVNEFRKDLKP